MKCICGIYQIRCEISGRIYIGSSVQISARWYAHRRDLRLGIHHSKWLQRAWNKYGKDAFVFSVIEECSKEVLIEREQFYLDTLNPDYNISRIAGTPPPVNAMKTHCHKGHEYSSENAHINKRGGRICRKCAADRAAARIAAEAPEQTAARLAKGREYIARKGEERLVKVRAYMAANRDKKRAYDAARRAARKAMGPPKPQWLINANKTRAALAARGIIV